MYRAMLLLLAFGCAACSSLQSADELLSGAPDMRTGKGDAVTMAKYEVRDNTIELVAPRQVARSPLEDKILALVNRERASAGIKPLAFSPELAKAAREHSLAMARAGFFEHRGDGEPELFDRVTASGMTTSHVGENIFEISTGAAGVADECVRMWMQSEGHRHNLLSPDFEKTGIAVGISRSGENYITEDFAH